MSLICSYFQDNQWLSPYKIETIVYFSGGFHSLWVLLLLHKLIRVTYCTQEFLLPYIHLNTPSINIRKWIVQKEHQKNLWKTPPSSVYYLQEITWWMLLPSSPPHIICDWFQGLFWSRSRKHWKLLLTKATE